jgi:site-specific DNA recombinase
MTATNRPRVRCAIYTRKSSEEGLEQSFNSLHAQREACEAYIVSQRHEGWHLIPKKYDDGGFSGGNMNRPALKQLLEDIAARLVDTVVVYKVDRLTRSLIDFAKIIEAFDQQGVSFVSVTQQFNTTSSMGRLTLNVLLSFAQFEREVTGERIRDKIAASKKKGMWMGGVVPLGYDLKAKKLVINDKEAKIVREIFEQYLVLGSVLELKKHLDRKRIHTKVRTSADGRTFGGERYSRGSLYKLLNNQIYLGRVAHRGESYDGQHPAIIASEVWEKVAGLLKGNNQGQRKPGRSSVASMLTGLVFDAGRNPYTPTHAVKSSGRRYRYYTSQAVIQKRKKPSQLDRIPALELESLVSSQIRKLLASPERFSAACLDGGYADADLRSKVDAAQAAATGWPKLTSVQSVEFVRHVVRKVVIRGSEIRIDLHMPALIARVLHQSPEHVHPQTSSSGAPHLTLITPFTLLRYRAELRLLEPEAGLSEDKSSASLLKAILRAHIWKLRIIRGEVHSKEEIARGAKLNTSYVRQLLKLASLGPDVIDAVVLHKRTFRRSLPETTHGISLDWNNQNYLLV